MKYWKQLGQSLSDSKNNDISFPALGMGLAMNSTGDIIACGQGTFEGEDTPLKIFKFNNLTSKWEQLGNSISPEITDNENIFGAGNGWYVDLSDDGYTLVTNTNNSYIQVYNYNEQSNTWEKKGFNIHGEPPYFNAGISISSDGNIIALGNPINTNNIGMVRVFKYQEYTQTNEDNEKYHYQSYNNNTEQLKPLIMTENTDTPPVVGNFYWTQLGIDIDGNPESDNYLGYRLSLSKDGSTLAIGGRHSHPNSIIPSEEGNVKVYTYNSENDNWEQKGSTIWGEKPWDFGGVGVALSRDGHIVAMSHPINEYNSNRKGYVKIFYYNFFRNDWVQLGETINESAKKDNNYGWNIDLSDDGFTILIGAYKTTNPNINNKVDMGRVYEPTQVFKFNPIKHQWEQKGQDIKGIIYTSGHNVKINSDGSRIVIGSWAANLVEVYEYVDDPIFEIKMKAVLKKYPVTKFKIKENIIEYVLKMWDIMQLI